MRPSLGAAEGLRCGKAQRRDSAPSLLFDVVLRGSEAVGIGGSTATEPFGC